MQYCKIREIKSVAEMKCFTIICFQVECGTWRYRWFVSYDFCKQRRFVIS